MLVNGSALVSAAVPVAQPASAGRTVIVYQDGLTVSWSTPDLAIAAEEDSIVSVHAGEWAVDTVENSSVSLPYDALLIALPPNIEPQLTIIYPDAQYVTSLALSASTDTSSPVTFVELGTSAGVRLASLRFDCATVQEGELFYWPSASVEISWNTAVVDEGQPAPAWVADSVVNPQHALVAREANTIQTAMPSVEGDLYAQVDEAGLYSLDAALLVAQGWESVDLRQVCVFHGDEQVATLIEDDGDIMLESGERILFYAEPEHNRYALDDAYRITLDASALAMDTRSASLGTLPEASLRRSVLLEQDLLYTPDCLCGSLPAGHDGDMWAWAYLRVPDATAFETSVDLDDVAVNASGVVTAWFIGGTSVLDYPDHMVELWINGVRVGQGSFDGKTLYALEVDIPSGVLVQGENTLRVVLPGSGASVEACWLDAIQLSYSCDAFSVGGQLIVEGEESVSTYQVILGSGDLLFDITDVFTPVQLDTGTSSGSVYLTDTTGGQRYLLVDEDAFLTPVLRQAQQVEDESGNCLIITQAELMPAAQRLAAWRTAQGYGVVLVNVQAIYDTFGSGVAEPEAIRAYLQYAYEEWPADIAGVTLFGGGTSDPRQNVTDIETFIPIYLADVDPWAGETAADNRYACVDGADSLPDLALGRLPAWSLAEAQTMVDTLVAYESDGDRQPWHGSAVLVSDDQDTAGDFYAISQQSSTFLPQGAVAQTLALQGSSTSYSDASEADAASIRQALVAAWQQGIAFVQFSGHSSWQQWAIESVLHLDNLPWPNTIGQVPVVLELTCFTGAFQRPEATLDRTLVSSGKAIAVFGPSGLGINTGHDQLAQGFVAALYDQEQMLTLGQIANAARLQLAASGRHLELLDTYTLLGDPLVIPHTGAGSLPYACYLPLNLR